jgi:pyruvate dehydrogenase E1 component alpha subunit
VAFFGDGAMAEGVLHESLNIASLLSLPVLFACEANGWSEFSPTSAQISFSLEALASAYRIPYRRIDSHDVRTIATDAAAIVADMRARVGPYVIECVTHRVRGHFEGDPQRYRSDQAEYVDPLAFTRAALAGEGVQQALLDRIDQDVAADIDAAIRLATQSRIAEFGAARAGVYAPDIAA